MSCVGGFVRKSDRSTLTEVDELLLGGFGSEAGDLRARQGRFSGSPIRRCERKETRDGT